MANVANMLGLTCVQPIRVLEKCSKDFGGDAMYKKIIADAEDQLHRLSCFVAGTLVHTKEGLKPIEQIKVGDYVLSKPESGMGEASYQRVVKTFESEEDKEVYFAAWTVEDLKVPRNHPVDRGQFPRGYAVVTGEHPFWVKHVTTLDEESLQYIVHEVNAWISIESIIKMQQDRLRTHGNGFNFKVGLADGRVASLVHYKAILQHREPDLGISFLGSQYLGAWDLCGPAIRFTKDGPVATFNEHNSYDYGCLYEDDAIDYDYDDQESLVTQSMGYLPMRRKVYNIEVENTHTYFVGELGVWVHNTCKVEQVLIRNPGA